MLKIGVAKRNINPPADVPHGGWGAQTHVFASGIESDFVSTVMVVSDDQSRSVLIDVDTPQFTIEQTGEVREAVAGALGIAVANIRLAVSHTHAGPMLWSSYYAEGKDAAAAYMRDIVSKTVEAALEAKGREVPVTVGSGFGTCRIGVNRRQKLASGRVVVGAESEGITDPAVGVVRFEDEAHRTVATVVQYGCHPTVLGFTNDLQSPDYPGAMKRFVEKNLGGVCLFLQGCAGNVGPGPEGFLRNTAAMLRMGAALGAAAVQTALEIEAGSYRHRFSEIVESGAPLGIWKSEKVKTDDTLKVLSRGIPVPLKKLMPVEEARAAYAGYERELAALHQRKASEDEIKEITYKVKRAYITLHNSEMYGGKTSAEIDTHFMRIGDILLIGSQIEPFAEIGLKIKEISPFPFTLFGGYSNGVMGYLPIGYAYAEGGYEVEATPYSSEAADHFIKGIGEVMQELR